MAVSKKKRAHKVSRGEHGATKHPLTEIEKALADKGVMDREERYQQRNPITPWKGATEPFKNGPFDRAQVEENRRLYPHLFGGKR